MDVSMRSTLAVRSPLARGVFVLVVLVSLAVLFMPPSGVPGAPPGVDKIVHASLFAALASSGRWAGGTRPVLTGVLVGYGAVSEVVQSTIGRDAAVGDLLADVCGVLLGLLAWHWITRRATR
jgi:hypothetical protein